MRITFNFTHNNVSRDESETVALVRDMAYTQQAHRGAARG